YPISRRGHERTLHPRADVIRRRESCVDTAAPVWTVRGNSRELESQRLPIGAQHSMEQKTAVQAPQRKSQGVRLLAPVGAVARTPVPFDLPPTQELIEGRRGLLHQYIAALPKLVETPHEPVNIRVPFEQAPVEPADLAVLAVGIVIPPLCPAHLV